MLRSTTRPRTVSETRLLYATVFTAAFLIGLASAFAAGRWSRAPESVPASPPVEAIATAPDLALAGLPDATPPADASLQLATPGDGRARAGGAARRGTRPHLHQRRDRARRVARLRARPAGHPAPHGAPDHQRARAPFRLPPHPARPRLPPHAGRRGARRRVPLQHVSDGRLHPRARGRPLRRPSRRAPARAARGADRGRRHDQPARCGEGPRREPPARERLRRHLRLGHRLHPLGAPGRRIPDPLRTPLLHRRERQGELPAARPHPGGAVQRRGGGALGGLLREPAGTGRLLPHRRQLGAAAVPAGAAALRAGSARATARRATTPSCGSRARTRGSTTRRRPGLRSGPWPMAG